MHHQRGVVRALLVSLTLVLASNASAGRGPPCKAVPLAALRLAFSDRQAPLVRDLVKEIGKAEREHGDNDGCVCHLIGKEVEIEGRYETPFVGTPTYHIAGMTMRVRRSEVTLSRSLESAGERQP